MIVFSASNWNLHRYPDNVASRNDIQLGQSSPVTKLVTPSQTRQVQDIPQPSNQRVGDNDDLLLVQEFDVRGANADELLGYEDDEDEGEGEVDSYDGCEDDPTCHLDFQRQVRLNATWRAEGNRRPGGLKTQRAMRRAWEASVCFHTALPCLCLTNVQI